jgi:condensin complex subunit 1
VQTTKVSYLKDMLNFIKQIEMAIPKLTQLLFSKTQTDVIEVISFFVTCYQHGFIDMLFGIRKMLTLLLTSEKTISDAVINAYRQLYLDNSASDPVHTAMGLIKLTYSLTISEYNALEQLIGAFAETDEVINKIAQVLWEIFAQKSQVNQIKDEDACGALILLSMIIKKQPLKGEILKILILKI